MVKSKNKITRPIILASASKARKELLEKLGLEFRVVETGIRENHSLKNGPRRLVMENARRKAEAAAKKFDSGVVIAADTVVRAGRRIIGKPKDLDDAFRTLKLLSRKPQWVYTGLAVVDIDRRKTYTVCEKTKIYMYPLSDEQIRNYFKRVSPLDKAGSFDLQGPGGIFIDRIEGCFYNVVGLPLARLARILKKTGIEIF